MRAARGCLCAVQVQPSTSGILCVCRYTMCVSEERDTQRQHDHEKHKVTMLARRLVGRFDEPDVAPTGVQALPAGAAEDGPRALEARGEQALHGAKAAGKSRARVSVCPSMKDGDDDYLDSLVSLCVSLRLCVAPACRHLLSRVHPVCVAGTTTIVVAQLRRSRSLLERAAQSAV